MQYKDLYVTELLQNIKNFVTEGISCKQATSLECIPPACYIIQYVTGEYSAFSGIVAPQEVLNAFAAAYAKFDIDESMTGEILADFLNLSNGRFAVSLSDTLSIESTLSVPEFTPPGNPKGYTDTYCLPVDFPFGTVNFIFSED